MNNKKQKLLLDLYKKHEYSLIIWAFINTMAGRLHWKFLYKKAQYKKHETCKQYLRKNYDRIVKKYMEQCKTIEIEMDTISENSPIWIFWAQGDENLPYPVNLCIQSIKRHSGKRKVLLLDINSYQDYVSLPDYIEEKFRAGDISYAHFSDILRLALLKKYGGIWIDSTIYMCNDIPNQITDYIFYSINQGSTRNWIVTRDKWSICYLASNKENILINFWYEFLSEYWKQENGAIAYLFADCILAIGYEDIPYFKMLIDKIPINNKEAFIIDEILKDEISDDITFNKLVHDNYLFKLTYKKIYLTDIQGEKTYFGKLIEY